MYEFERNMRRSTIQRVALPVHTRLTNGKDPCALGSSFAQSEVSSFKSFVTLSSTFCPCVVRLH